MSREQFNPERLEELLFLSAGGSLTEDQYREINDLLRDSAAARSFAVRSLTVDSLLIEALAARGSAGNQERQSASSKGSIGHFGRAAAWIGGLVFFGSRTQSAAAGSATVTQTTITILMKKTFTSITAAILVLGSAGVYVIHRHNESRRQRVAGMETEVKFLSDQLGIESSSIRSSESGSRNAESPVSIVQVLAVYDGDNVINSQEAAILEQFKQQLAVMDAESLRSLLLDAEKISNPVNGRVAESILDALMMLDPAEAARTATLLSGRSNSFNYQLCMSAARAFGDWLEKDLAAADAWYRETLDAGGLRARSIPPNGLEEHDLERSFGRMRLKAMVESDSAGAEAMLATMLPRDVTSALREVTDPKVIGKILPKLQPEQRVTAAMGVIEDLAAEDPNAALDWAGSLEIPVRERDTLVAGGIKNAVAGGKLDLAAVSEWTRKLDLDAGTRSDTQIDAAVSASRLPGGDTRATDWEGVAERIDWLRKEATPESADRMVGEYLGKLAYNSRTPDQSIKAYEAEIARRGNPDPALTIAYARYLGMFGTSRFGDNALKYLRALPPSRERDQAIEMIEINR